MKKKQEKGAIGVDIAIAVVTLFIFVSVIATLLYQYQSSTKEIELKSNALGIAVKEIERIKQEGFETYKDMNSATDTGITNKDLGEENSNNDGFFETVKVEDYTDLPEGTGKTANLVKKVTVTISYMFKGQAQKVELNTVLSSVR